MLEKFFGFLNLREKIKVSQQENFNVYKFLINFEHNLQQQNND